MSRVAAMEPEISSSRRFLYQSSNPYQSESQGKMMRFTTRQQKRATSTNDANNNEQIDQIKLKHGKNNLGTSTISQLPANPYAVLGAFSDLLSSFERIEIAKFNEIYYIGNGKLVKNRVFTTPTATDEDGMDYKNYGFDDINGSYLPVMHDHIAYRYEILKVIGKGTFGSVLKAYDHKMNREVALKIVRNQKRFHVQSVQEIKILALLREKDVNDKMNVIHMFEDFTFRNHPCITFELLSLNLYEFTKNNNFKGFRTNLIRRFAYAILRCLDALSDFKIIHCDLKPENVLLKQQNRSGIKVIDFGSSCFMDSRIHNYIQSRFYRSPEVILEANYGTAIDMWSFGCILVELFEGKPLFSGDDEQDQMACMMEVLGLPPLQLLKKASQNKIGKFFDQDLHPTYCDKVYNKTGKAKYYPGKSRKGRIREIPGFVALLPNCDDLDFKKFVLDCLKWDPVERMTPKNALKHVWMSKSRQDVPAMV